MPGVAEYRRALQALTEWEPFLLAHSGLPGPRGNLELAHAAADLGAAAQFVGWAALTPEEAPENTPQTFLAFCGVLGLGELLARHTRSAGQPAGPGLSESEILLRLRNLASDPRWRIREAVATGLQRWGDADMPALLAEMAAWADGNRLEQRAAIAALCEPRLLARADRAEAVLARLDRITATLPAAADRRTDAFKTLRQALGYAWSVAVVALPAAGKPLLEKWLASEDADVRWIMRENLRKKRLAAMDAAWVAQQLTV